MFSIKIINWRMCINTTLFQLFNLVSQYKNLFKNYSIISGKNECYLL